MTFSQSTLDLFASLLSQVQLSASDPHLVESAAVIVKAREELVEAAKELPIPLSALADGNPPP